MAAPADVRTPPHSEEAERCLLGALLIDPGRIPEVADLLQPDDFFVPRHAALWEAALGLVQRASPVDLVTLGEALNQAGTFQQVGGRAYLVELMAAAGSAAHVKHHAKVVADTATLRRLIRECSDVIGEAYGTRADGSAVQDLVVSAEDRVFRLSAHKDRGEALPIGKAVIETFRRIDSASHRRGLTGLPSGYYELDDLLCGFNAGDLIVVAARPSMGKTALVINCIDHAADPGHAPEWLDHPASILFFSLEMGHQSIVRRMLCARARVDAHRLRTGRIPTEDYAELSRAAGELAKLKVFIDDTPGMTAMGMRSRAKRVRSKHGLDLVVVDYLQLMSHPRAESRQQEISQISRALKELARELEVPVIALSQLSRAVESRDDKRPQLSDLRESGSIEQDADVVLLLYRDEYYHRDNPENKGQAEVICAKQRNGPTGVVPLLFNGSIMRFENRAPSAAEPFHG